jgi:hypothetical protein
MFNPFCYKKKALRMAGQIKKRVKFARGFCWLVLN